ncbi:MAG: glycoside hydrolase family 2 protein [Bacteroidetes bacterium]|nr:glycoside hydrolase family 2 protein [Bacteroidota bacterium]
MHAMVSVFNMRLNFKSLVVFSGLILFSVLLLISCRQPAIEQVQTLDDLWSISSDSIEIEQVKIPAEVHLALFDAGYIADPFGAGVEKDLQWVARQQWVWESSFVPDKQVLNNSQIELVFSGIDTYATVFLNEELLFVADNMFREWRIDVKGKLVSGSNHLKLVFRPSTVLIDSLAANGSVSLPDKRAFIRKAAFQMGWDWSPEIRTIGLWKTIALESWSQIKVDRVAVLQEEVTVERARLKLSLALNSTQVRTYKLQVFSKGRKLLDELVHVNKGINDLEIPFKLENPKLWWPNGMGSQEFTRFEIKLLDGNHIVKAEQLNVGLRNIRLIQEADSIGKSFFFEINGRPLYAKGANYVPEDVFPTRMNRTKTRKLLIDAASVGMNMIRVWGGGLYPSDYFYAICDSLGLLVWQDFMFANTLYPLDSAFATNVEYEITEQIKRLRGRTSLALWCGNNEIDEGFHNWGWQDQFDWSTKQADSLWKQYEQLFETKIDEWVSLYDPYTAYWPSSASGGWGRDSSYKSGDVHYWGVWWGEQDFETYKNKIGRFNSEFGFQAMPDMATLETMVKKDLLWPGSPQLEHFQKHPRGTALINSYMQKYFPVPEEIADYTYVSQLLQAYGLEVAIEAQRLSKPHSMGTLFWQLNDAWPAISWSVIDYYGRPKAAYYHLQRLYNPLIITVNEADAKVFGNFLNETGKPLSGRVTFDLLEFNGNILQASSLPLVIQPNEIKSLNAGFSDEVMQNIDPGKVWLRVRFISESKVLAEKFHFFAVPKLLVLPRHEVLMHLLPKNDRIEIVLQSPVFLKNLMLSSNDVNGSWETNYFDLPPGESIRINFYPSGEISQHNLRFETRSLNELVEN